MIDEETGEIVYKPFIRSRYNYDMAKASDESGLACMDGTKTQQQFAEECDINTIVERFGLTGELPNNLRMPITDEFIDTMDYQTALNKIIEADDAFMQLPAHVRAEFQNDAGKFVEFVSDEKNLDRARELGIATPAAAAREPLEVRIAKDPAAPAAPIEGAPGA